MILNVDVLSIKCRKFSMRKSSKQLHLTQSKTSGEEEAILAAASLFSLL